MKSYLPKYSLIRNRNPYKQFTTLLEYLSDSPPKRPCPFSNKSDIFFLFQFGFLALTNPVLIEIRKDRRPMLDGTDGVDTFVYDSKIRPTVRSLAIRALLHKIRLTEMQAFYIAYTNKAFKNYISDPNLTTGAVFIL